VVFNVNRRFTEELSASLSCDYFQNKVGTSNVSTTNYDVQTFTINPGLSYQFNNSWRAIAQYEYIHIHEDTGNSSNIRASTISMSITYSFKLME
jgi:predicted porin